jgi:phosphoribosylglycinamide formyltransferase 1
MNTPLPVVVLISGRGSNLQSILDATAGGALPVEIRAVISNRPDAPGLQRSALLGIRTIVIDHACYSSRAAFEAVLQTTIDAFEPGLLVLAGFMRVLAPEFVTHYRGRILNIHPSLLPEFPGLNTHQRVLEAGKRESGATVHFVTPETDGGPVILQARVPVLAGDDAASLAQRVLEQEHRILPLAIRWFAEGRVRLDAAGRVILDGTPLERPRLLHPGAQEPA